MLFLVFILLLLVLFITASYLVHEYSHALVARLVGWETMGMTIRWYGAGYKIKINQDKPKDIWKIAAGGLLGTALLILIGLSLSYIFPVFHILWGFNLVIFIINILPIKGLDGYYIVRGLVKGH